MSPLCERYVSAEKLNEMEPFHPLRVYDCEYCFLFQIDEYLSPEEPFSEYAYFSSYSDSWVEHMRRYADIIAARLRLGKGSLVVEVASNDCYLLQHFVRKGIPVLGIEPAANVSESTVRAIAYIEEGKRLAGLVDRIGTCRHDATDLLAAKRYLAAAAFEAERYIF